MELTEDTSKTRDEMQQKIEVLQQELKTSKEAMHRTQTCFHQHQAKSNFLTTSLQAQLKHRDQEIKRIREHQDRQIESIVSHLLFLEGQIRKDQKHYVSLLIEREKKIKDQQSEIDELKNRNNNLVAALKEVHVSSGNNGFCQVETQERHHEHANGNSSVQFRTPKEKEKTHKLKFTGMRERLRRHRSSFELHHPEPLETLEEMTFRSSSQENLTDEVVDSKNERRMVTAAKERPKSMIEMSSRNEYPLLEFPKEIELDREYEDEVYDKIEDDDIFTNGSNEPADLTKSYSMPHDISRIANGHPEEIKERPHSMSSVELLAAETAAKSPSHHHRQKSKHRKNHQQQQQQQEQTPQKHQSSPSEGNPFKSIKTMLKRKGSKLKNKKRSVSLPQGTNQEYAEALKKHFEKYDLS